MINYRFTANNVQSENNRLCFLLLLPLFLVPYSVLCQRFTNVELEQYVRKGIESYNSLNVDSITTGGLTGFENGFGYRSRSPRPALSPDATRSVLHKFLDGMDYYKITINEIQTRIDGDVGLAWGFFTEKFQRKGARPELVQVRFTVTVKKDQSGWRTLLAHRDAQQFDTKGNYIPLPPDE